MRVSVAHITTIDLSLRYLLLNQLRSIQADGYDVCGISTFGPDVSTVVAAGIPHIPVAMTRNFTPTHDFAALARLVRVMRREQFTIVHTHNPKPGLIGQLAARIAGVPIVVNTVHGFYFHDGMAPKWRKFYIMMEKLAARCSDVILSQNEEDILTALREGICSASQIKTLGNGIDLQRFDRRRIEPHALDALRSRFHLCAERPVVGFVGRLVKEKGILELLQAAKQVLAIMPDVQFLVVGPLDTEKADALTPAIAETYGLAEAFTFTGLQQEMPELYALMDVFVLPSHREGFPRSPMEASAMGVPSIVTNIRGCREAVEHEQNGLHVPLGDVSALADAIISTLSNRDIARQMGRVGRQMAEARFDEQLVFAIVKAEYARLLAAKGITANGRE
jgi:glycosyltransferase involved in cell wall biosynthesis